MPIDVTCQDCSAKFQLKDEFAGKKVRCNQCKAVIEIPDVVEVAFADDSGVHPAFQRDKFLLHQKHFSINERYSVFDESGQEIMHVERPAFFWQQVGSLLAVVFSAVIGIGVMIGVMLALHDSLGETMTIAIGVLGIVAVAVGAVFIWSLTAPKRHITFYTDETKQQKLLEVLQDQKIAIRMATYTVLDENGQEIGRFRKDYLMNIIRKRWDGFNKDQEKFIVIREDSIVLSLLRRFLGTFYGLLRTNFVIYEIGPDGNDGSLLGEFNRKFTLFDKYVLDCTHDRARGLDRRLAVAIGVLLDTGEKR